MTENESDAAMTAGRLTARAELLPEELAAGSDAPEAQAAAILADSDRRTTEAADGPDGEVEHRRADELTDPEP
ncbi:MAG: hypothetical protein NVSMB13_17870 [Mycobacteriales bacterium]